jgi:beta-N-acetylhexosaminidase
MTIKTWRSLTLREKVCQTVVLNGYLVGEMDRYGNLKEVIQQCGGLANFLKEYPVGGFFVGGEVIKEATQGSEDVKDVIRQYKEAASIPLLFCSDMENGCGSMVKGLTPFPYLMALGAGRSEELAYEYGKATALEARSIGVNWSFSPVADLNQSRFNPITNIRAVGQDAKLVKSILGKVIAGMQDYGLVATAKHFPGDGTDYRDQHLVTTSNNLSLESWKNNHGEVFQHLIDSGLACIMTGHISLPAQGALELSWARS